MYTHAIFVDESGRGLASTSGPDRHAACGAIEVDLENLGELARDLQGVKEEHLRSSTTELKGGGIKGSLKKGSSIDDVAADIGAVMKEHQSGAWFTAARHNTRVPGTPRDGGPVAVACSRQLLFERLNGYLPNFYVGGGKRMIIWDNSSQTALDSLGSTFGSFSNPHSGTTVTSKLRTSPLAGLSHDWSPLQIADFVAHLGLHFTMDRAWNDSTFNQEKADAFENHILRRLKSNAKGYIAGVGFKVWPPD